MRDASSDFVNGTLARTYSRAFLRDGDYAFIDRAQGRDGSPSDLYWYFNAVWIAWLFGVPIFELLFTGLAYVATTISGDGENEITVKVFVFCAAFCVTGAADAIWRCNLIARARRLLAQTDENGYRRGRRLVRVARIPTGSLLVQAAVALFVASKV